MSKVSFRFSSSILEMMELLRYSKLSCSYCRSSFLLMACCSFSSFCFCRYCSKVRMRSCKLQQLFMLCNLYKAIPTPNQSISSYSPFIYYLPSCQHYKSSAKAFIIDKIIPAIINNSLTMIVEQKVTILCPICGIKFTPENANICPACTLSSLDSESLLSPNEEQLFCTYCLRYERPPWINCERESPQLLGVLLKKIKGLSKLQLKDAKFVWTEPHSKRIKIKVDFVRVINETTRIQQSEIVEFVEKYTQCPECKKNFTPHDWNVLIQIRQHASHKRTLLALQQNLIRQKWTEKALRIETADQGFDLFYRNEQDAHGCLNYIKNHLPVTSKTSSQFISHNERDNTTNVKTTHALIIPKICKDDLLLMHPKWAKPLGCSTLLLCVKVTSQLYFLDMTNNRRLVITPTQFFALQPYADIYSLKHHAKNYLILDNQGPRSEESHNQFGTWGLVIALAEEMKEIFIKSHINAEVGDEYQGYCLQDWAYIKNMPTHVLVKKMKTEEEKEKRKVKKDQKRREDRAEKKRQRLTENQSVSHMEDVEPEEKQEDLGEEWVDVEDDDV